MEFTIPQFIEKEPKIVGPFTFKQFVFIGIAGGTCLILFFLVPLSAFVVIAIILLGGAFALAFVKIEKISLPAYIKNSFIFILKPKLYLWKRKTHPPKLSFKREIKFEREIKEYEEEKPKKESVLKITEGSKLRELFTYLETKWR